MFEDLSKNAPVSGGPVRPTPAPNPASTAPSQPSQPSEPVDIFSETESLAPKQRQAAPNQPIPPIQPMQMASGMATPGFNWKKILIFGGIIIGVIVIIFIGFMLLDRMLTPSEPIITNYVETETEAEETQTESESNLSEVEEETLPNEEPVEAEADFSLGADSDGDGLTDYDEIHVYDTDPFAQDTDKDGLFDKEEASIYGTDPLNPDSDGDGMSDGAEVRARRNPLGEGDLATLPNGVSATGTDSGLNALAEEAETVPAIDSDNDGLFDDEEAIYGTDPSNPDTDGDGYSDGEEVGNGYNPLGEGKLTSE